MQLKIEYLAVDELKPYDNNTRKHAKKDIENIAKSIEKYGMNDAIGIWSDENIIVEGHGRVMACRQLGIEQVPCVRLDHMSDKQRREYAIAHNATAELSEWDFKALEIETADIDLSEFDFEIEFAEPNCEIIEDEVPEINENADPKARLGDIYQLGRHRLMCGDSTSTDDVAKLMDGQKADMVFTDPPYNIASDSKNFAADVSKSMGTLSKSEWDKDFDISGLFPVLESSLAENFTVYMDEGVCGSLFILRMEQTESYAVIVKKTLDLEHGINLLCNKREAYVQFPKRWPRIKHLDDSKKERGKRTPDRKACGSACNSNTAFIETGKHYC